jgi:hypothetical protein
MKKISSTRRIQMLFLALFCLLAQAGAKEIYVSPDGSPTGSGTQGDPVNFVGLKAILGVLQADNIINVHFEEGTYSEISLAPTPTLNTLLNNARLDGKTLNFIGEGTDTNPAILDGGGSVFSLVQLEADRSAAGYFTFTIYNMVIQQFSGNSATPFIRVDDYNAIKLDKVTIQNCNNPNTTVSRLNSLFCHYSNSYTHLEITNSSIINNNRGGRLIHHEYSGTFLFYNNTVSGNTCTYAIYDDDPRAGFFDDIVNNTFYRTGGIQLATSGNGARRFLNNIITNGNGIGATIPSMSNINEVNTRKNIIGDSIYESSNTGGVFLPTLYQDFNTTLDETPKAPGRQVHRPMNFWNHAHSLAGRGLSAAEIQSEISPRVISLTKDQLGDNRPTSGNLALGSIECDNFKVAPLSDIYIVNDLLSGAPVQSTVEIDLNTVILHVPSFLPSPTFRLNTQMSGIGTLDPLVNNKTTFRLASGLTANATATFTYDIKDGTNTTIYTGNITVHYIIFDTRPPGYLEPASECSAYMGKVNFTSKYLFRSQLVGTNGTSERMYGFSIPLVGDLNGDGNPEIIGIATAGTGSLYGNYNGIHIYDGHTGRRINRLYFPGSTASNAYYHHNGVHGAPSMMALVDSDRDGTVELIVAFPHLKTGGVAPDYKSQVVSFNLVYNASTQTYSINQRWIATGGTYNNDVTAYDRPMPQVVDLDGDGSPEVVVYNRVYNARTGELLRTLETITTAHIGRSTYDAYDLDEYIGSPYAYDMDLDGIYDIVAGGKIYQMHGTNSVFSAPTQITMPNVSDGHTGVADINGDGKPDVVVVRRTSSTNLEVDVWTPGFDSNGIAHPEWIASRRSITISSNLGGGRSSYVYIGDIDGREQVHNGKTYRLPEIAFLTGQLNTTLASLPRHPNIAGIPAGDALGQGGIPTEMASTRGALLGLTFDPSDETLKASFILEHYDRSINTGFTMFDFDNDGIQELCYRDEQTLRIIKPTIPYVKDAYTTNHVSGAIKFRQVVNSYTGFEYPVIADIDNDASADMVVMGHEDGDGDPHGFIYALSYDGAIGDKFAPALPVWNQFMYDPFKIKPNLQTPTKAEGLHAIDRLSPIYTFRREVKDENNDVDTVIAQYNPFNGTLLQVPYYTILPGGEGNNYNFEPVVNLLQAYVIDNDGSDAAQRPLITGSGATLAIEITIGSRSGAKTDVPSTIPIAVYKNNRVSKANFVKKVLLSTLEYQTGPSSWAVFGATKTVAAGETVRVRIPIANLDAESVYIIRLGDDSDTSPETPIWRFGLNDKTAGSENPNLGIGVAARRFRDCNWDDQDALAARSQAIDDTQTVQEFHSVAINVWNDILPNTYFANNLSIPHDSMKIILNPKAGELSFSGQGRNSRITYTHDGGAPLTQAIDSFWYEVTFWDVSRPVPGFKTDTATVYIYVLESTTGGFAACYGELTTVSLANKPPGVTFDWYKAVGDTLIVTARERSIRLYADSVYQLDPIMPDGAFDHLDFPRGKLTVSRATTSSTHAVMRWTGLADHNWKNPANWVEVVNGSYERPVAWAPTGCVDVIIPSGAANYPELTDSVRCGVITLKDRAMLQNPHVLTHSGASVELKLTPAEKDRFIMWSAPLRDMYSGDYHFKKSDGAPNWGDSYMMFFQMGNPDISSSAVVHTMTATVGRPNQSLALGTAFNFRLAATSINRDSVLTFPKSATSYTGADGNPYTLTSRANKSHFITDGQKEEFNLPVANPSDASTVRILQVVNPYMAWLKVGDFLSGNTELQGAYMDWDGGVNTGIVSYYTGGAAGMRYFIPSVPNGATTGMIAPLKSFFVIAKSAPAPTTLKMNAKWTTTSGTSSPYTLRATAAPVPAQLYVKAVQGDKSSSTLLRYDPQAIANYRETEDIYQLFYDGTDGTDGIALTLYSMAPWGEALAINSSDNFTSRNTPLGLHIREAGEVKLSFSGVQNFGHDIWLIDRVLNKETRLQENSSYTFTVAKTGNKPVDINDRFSLYMKYTGLTGSETPSASLSGWSVSTRDRNIYVQSASGVIRDLQVYDVTGAGVYRSQGPSEQFRIPVVQGVYILKAQFDNEQKIEKVFVR